VTDDPASAHARAETFVFSSTAVITPRQLIAGARAATLRATVTLAILIILLLVASLLLQTWGLVPGAALLGLGLYLLPRRIHEGRLDGPRTWTITITEDEYRQASDQGEASAYAWANFSKAKHVGEFWVLRAGRLVLTIPDEAFDDREHELFRALLRRKHLIRT
jgi:YcxB-like protein